MSLIGWRDLRLDPVRREQLRLERVRRNARTMIATCENTIAGLRDPAVQQAVARELKAIPGELRELARRVDDAPDATMKSVRKCQKNLHRAITEAQAAALQWNRKRTAAAARVAEVSARIEAEQTNSMPAAMGLMAEAQSALIQSQSLLQQGQIAGAESASDRAEQLLEKAATASFDETIRREVVRSLLATLQGKGFVVDGPRLTAAQESGGVVELKGRLPSGREARFEVHVDGKMRFDFEGYEGRSCAAELAQVEKVLQERCDILLGPTQVTWKNPDRLGKGARNLPVGGERAKVG